MRAYCQRERGRCQGNGCSEVQLLVTLSADLSHVNGGGLVLVSFILFFTFASKSLPSTREAPFICFYIARARPLQLRGVLLWACDPVSANGGASTERVFFIPLPVEIFVIPFLKKFWGIPSDCPIADANSATGTCKGWRSSPFISVDFSVFSEIS